MPTQKKIDTVADLKERIGRATLVATAEYRGLRVKEMVEMRRRLREAGIEIQVIKNTLLKLAAEGAAQPDILRIVEGPTALAMTFGDVIDAAKALAGYAQGAPTAFAIRGGYMDGSVLSAQDLRDLVRVPPKPVLLAQFMGQMQSPLANFVALLDAPLRELYGLMQALLSELPGLIEARASQLEASGGGVEPAVAEESHEEAPEPQPHEEVAEGPQEEAPEPQPQPQPQPQEEVTEAPQEDQGTEIENTEETREAEPTTEDSEKEESNG